MRKLTLLFTSLFIISCSTDDAPDCNCDRIIGPITEFTIVNPSNDGFGTTRFGNYTTINDCTGIQRSWNWSGTRPRVGDCKQ